MDYGKVIVTGTVDFNNGISVEIPKHETNFNVVEPFNIEKELEGFERGFLGSTNPGPEDTYTGHLQVGITVGSAAYSYEYEYSARTHELKRVEA
nr:MAG TPA: hypothetical protein [Bacteriophage sp.]